MDHDLSSLKEGLLEAEVDGYLLEGDNTLADLYYLSNFAAPDPIVCLQQAEACHLLVSGLEYGRARAESAAASVSRYSDYNYQSRVDSMGPMKAMTAVVADFLDEFDASSVLVPERFPLARADGLRDRSISVRVDADNLVGQCRSRKSEQELDHLRTVQRANEAAMTAALDRLREASIDGDQLLEAGEVLTSESIKVTIEQTLLEHRCGLDDVIVAGGSDAANPHERGSGPLPAHEPIVIDIFPRHKDLRYFADMTRTVVVGEPSNRHREWFSLVEEAKARATEEIAAGVTGRAVHEAACEVFEAAGHPTLRSDPETETGFIHGTGHGLGLDIHEAPRLSLHNRDELEAGNVVTVEPGLYDPAVGGIRIEDVVVVTEDGCRPISSYPVMFHLSG